MLRSPNILGFVQGLHTALPTSGLRQGESRTHGVSTGP